MRLEVVHVDALALESLQRVTLDGNGETIFVALDFGRFVAVPLLGDELASSTFGGPGCLLRCQYIPRRSDEC